MYFNRSDILAAWYVWLSGRADSKSKSRLANLKKRWIPGPAFSYRTLTDNGRAILRRLERL